MSATASAEHVYFQAIEAAFVRLRGTPFLLSPADWRLASDWHRQGVPLEVVEAALEEVFTRRAERGEVGKVQSLRYCRAAVEEAWSRRLELEGGTASAEAAPLAVAERLAALAAALPREAAGIGRRLLALEGDAADVERRLEELDRELLAEAEAHLDEPERGALEARVEAALAPLAERLPAEEVEAYRPRLRERELRRRADLPLLSLFAPEALRAPGKDEPAS